MFVGLFGVILAVSIAIFADRWFDKPVARILAFRAKRLGSQNPTAGQPAR